MLTLLDWEKGEKDKIEDQNGIQSMLLHQKNQGALLTFSLTNS